MKNIIKYFISILAFCTFCSCNDIFEAGPPEQPIINSIGTRSINSIDLFWSKYDGDDFDRYEVYCKYQYSSNYILYTTIKNERQVYVTVSGLNPKTLYQFYVKTIDKKGFFAESQVYNLETLNDQPSAFVIYNVLQEDVQYSSVKLIWSPYKDEYAVPFSRYEVYCSISSGFPNTTLTKKVIIKNEIPFVIITDLNETTTYYFKVRTYNNLEKYSESSVVNAHTPAAPPSAIGLFEPADVSESFVKLNWTKSLDTAFLRYEVYMTDYMKFFPDSSNLVKVIAQQDKTDCEINNLEKYKEYFAKVIIFKNNNTHSISNEIGFTAYPGGGPVPVEILDPPDEFISSTSINIQWTKTLSRYLDQYEVHMSTTPNFTPGPSSIRAYIESAETNYYLAYNLKKNTTYYFKVMVYTQLVRYVYSKEKAVTTKP